MQNTDTQNTYLCLADSYFEIVCYQEAPKHLTDLFGREWVDKLFEILQDTDVIEADEEFLSAEMTPSELSLMMRSLGNTSELLKQIQELAEEAAEKLSKKISYILRSKRSKNLEYLFKRIFESVQQLSFHEATCIRNLLLHRLNSEFINQIFIRMMSSEERGFAAKEFTRLFPEESKGLHNLYDFIDSTLKYAKEVSVATTERPALIEDILFLAKDKNPTMYSTIINGDETLATIIRPNSEEGIGLNSLFIAVVELQSITTGQQSYYAVDFKGDLFLVPKDGIDVIYVNGAECTLRINLPDAVSSSLAKAHNHKEGPLLAYLDNLELMVLTLVRHSLQLSQEVAQVDDSGSSIKEVQNQYRLAVQTATDLLDIANEKPSHDIITWALSRVRRIGEETQSALKQLLEPHDPIYYPQIDVHYVESIIRQIGEFIDSALSSIEGIQAKEDDTSTKYKYIPMGQDEPTQELDDNGTEEELDSQFILDEDGNYLLSSNNFNVLIPQRVFKDFKKSFPNEGDRSLYMNKIRGLFESSDDLYLINDTVKLNTEDNEFRSKLGRKVRFTFIYSGSGEITITKIGPRENFYR